MCNFTRKVFLNNFKLLAKEGTDPFYKGEIAQSVVNCVQEAGGCLTMEDMAQHETTFDQPISTVYKDKLIWEMPPNDQGIVALMALNVLSGFDLTSSKSAISLTFHKPLSRVILLSLYVLEWWK